MSKINTGGAAFPSWLQEMADDTVESLHKGMTLRDYFAAKAMQAYITAWTINREHPLLDETTAQSAYMAADAMLKARDA